jgi:hypothetical protein
MTVAAMLLMFFLLASAGFASDKDTQQYPVAWGVLSKNTGCVIFEEGHKTNGKFWGVAVITKTVGKLTVIETQNYTLEEKTYLETQEELNALMQRAQEDKIKYVKIPEKYAPPQLESARRVCSQDSVSN